MNKTLPNRIKTKRSHAIAFAVLPDGQLKQLWSFQNWDHFTPKRYTVPRYPRFHLSNDGMNLVTIYTYSADLKSDVVVMRSKGKEKKRYQPTDFGVTKLKWNCPSNNWRSSVERKAFAYEPDTIDINTINNTSWKIDVNSLELTQEK